VTGNIHADYRFSSAVEPEQGKIRPFFAVSARVVKLDDDWEGFGQKLTGSGTAVFDRVRVPDADLFEVRSRADDGQPKLYGFTFHQAHLASNPLPAKTPGRSLAARLAGPQAGHDGERTW
jgi:alkylation response protein AidB-like acyl-CoA dehydrogenase